MAIRGDYPCHTRNYQGRRVQPVSFLVVHYVGALGDAEQNAWYYHSTPGIGASAHLFVDHGPEAEVWASVPEDCVASHCGRTDGRYRHPKCRNANSIGIEMCCRRDGAGKWYFDPETVARTAELCRALMERYQIDAEHVVRHYDVTGKLCPAPFVEETAWAAFKKRLEECEMTKEEVQALVKDEVDKALEERDALAAKAAEKVSSWHRGDWEAMTAAGVFDGTRPGGFQTREQTAAVCARLLKLMGGV